MTWISGQQKPFRFPFAIHEHRYPNHSDKTTAEEAGHADGGAIANGAVAAVDRQFSVRLHKRLELLPGDPIAVLPGPSWFSRPRWRRIIQGGVASDLADDDGVAREGIDDQIPLHVPGVEQQRDRAQGPAHLLHHGPHRFELAVVAGVHRQIRHQRHAPEAQGIPDHRRQADHRLGQDIVRPIGLAGMIVLDRGARRRLGHARDQGIVADHDATLGWKLPPHDAAQGMDHRLPVELPLAHHPIVARPVPPGMEPPELPG